MLDQGEQVVSQYEVFRYTLNNRKDPVYRNKPVPVLLDPIESSFIRRRRAIQIQNNEVGINYYKFFHDIPRYDSHEKKTKDRSCFDGVLIPKTPEPKTWEDYDVYISPASHYEIVAAAKGAAPEQWPDPAYPLFTLNYVRDRFTNQRLFIADLRRAGEGPIEQKVEAILRIIKPSYYFTLHDGKKTFAENKFV